MSQINNTSKVFFISDSHFGHKNIIKYSGRPFETVKEMDEALISNWNARVQPEDTIYHIGDFAFGDGSKDPGKYFNRLNGKKHLVLGNHDNKKAINLDWESVGSMSEISVGKQRIVLCHYAMRVWHHSYRGVWQLFGHSHGSLPENNTLAFDVGVDVWNYSPVSFEEVKRKMEWKQKNSGYFIPFSNQNDEVRSEEGMVKSRLDTTKLNKDFYK